MTGSSDASGCVLALSVLLCCTGRDSGEQFVVQMQCQNSEHFCQAPLLVYIGICVVFLLGETCFSSEAVSGF